MVECGICYEEYQEGDLQLHMELCAARLIFRCILCSEDFVSKEGLWNHLVLHKVEDEDKEHHSQELQAKFKLHQCILCYDQRAYSASTFRDHVKDVHDGYFLRCSDCGELFRSEELKLDHSLRLCKAKKQTMALDGNGPEKAESAHIKVEKVIQDQVVTLKLNDSLLEPLRVEVQSSSSRVTRRSENLKQSPGELSTITKASTNEKVSSNNQTKLSEYDKVLSDGSSWPCSVCEVIFKTKASLRHHKVVCHTEPAFKCSMCSMTFHFSTAMRRHRVGCSERRCHTCGILFPLRSQLNHHLKYEHRDSKKSKDVQIEGSDDGLNENRINEAGNEIQITDVRTERRPDNQLDIVEAENANDLAKEHPHSSTSNLAETDESEFMETGVTIAEDDEISTKGSDNPDNGTKDPDVGSAFYCSTCKISFRDRFALRYHKIYRHTAPKLKCPICSKAFHFPKDLRRHQKGCSELRCRICDTKFMKRSQLQDHMFYEHRNSNQSKDVPIEKSDDLSIETMINEDDSDIEFEDVRIESGQLDIKSKDTEAEKSGDFAKENKEPHSSNSNLDEIEAPEVMETEITFQDDNIEAEGFDDLGNETKHRRSRCETNNVQGEESVNLEDGTTVTRDDNEIEVTEKPRVFQICSDVDSDDSDDPDNGTEDPHNSNLNHMGIDAHEDGITIIAFKDLFAVEDACLADRNSTEPINVEADAARDVESSGIEHPQRNGSSAQCTICKETFKTVPSMRHHKVVRHTEPRFKCSACLRPFHYACDMRRHRKGCSKWCCPTCGAMCATRANLNLHISKKHGNSNTSKDVPIENSDEIPIHNKFNEDVTEIEIEYGSKDAEAEKSRDFAEENTQPPSSNSNLDVLEAPEPIETEITFQEDNEAEGFDGLENETEQPQRSGSPRQCTVCNETFKRGSSMRYHRIVRHTEPRFKCSVCLRPFHYACDVRRHRKGCSKWCCPTCGATFASRAFLKLHISEQHSNTSSSKDVPIENSDDLPIENQINEDGIEIEIGDGSEDVEVEQIFNFAEENKPPESSNSNLDVIEAPEAMETEIIFQGDNEAQGFDGVENETKQPQRSDSSRQCPICKETFKHGYSMRYHKVVRHTEPRFKCSICLRPFHFGCDMRRHRKGCTKWCCPTCGATCASRAYLNLHISENHSNTVIVITSKDAPIEISDDLPIDNKIYEDGNVIEIEDGSEDAEAEKSRDFAEENKQPPSSNSNLDEIEAPEPVETESTFQEDNEAEGIDSLENKSQHPQRSDTNRQCTICKEMFKHGSSMRYHRVVRHTLPRFKCSVCLRPYHFAFEMRRHRKGCSKWCCPTCGATCASRAYLNLHISENHRNSNESQDVPIEQSADLPMESKIYEDGNEIKIEYGSEDAEAEKSRDFAEENEQPYSSNANLDEIDALEAMETEITFQEGNEAEGFDGLENETQHPHKNGSPRQCTICNEMFKNASSMKYHRVVRHTTPRFECSVCLKPFHFACDMRRHRKGCSKWRCPICNTSCTSRDYLNHHIANKHPQNSDSSQVETVASDNRVNEITIIGSNDLIGIVDQCMEVVPSNEPQNVEIRRLRRIMVHPSGPKNVTNVGDEHSKDGDGIQLDHQSTSETSEPPQNREADRRWDCIICGAVFDRRGAYYYHKEMVHTKPRYKCKVCTKGFFAQSKLSLHEKFCVKRNLSGHVHDSTSNDIQIEETTNFEDELIAYEDENEMEIEETGLEDRLSGELDYVGAVELDNRNQHPYDSNSYHVATEASDAFENVDVENPHDPDGEINVVNADENDIEYKEVCLLQRIVGESNYVEAGGFDELENGVQHIHGSLSNDVRIEETDNLEDGINAYEGESEFQIEEMRLEDRICGELNDVEAVQVDHGIQHPYDSNSNHIGIGVIHAFGSVNAEVFHDPEGETKQNEHDNGIEIKEVCLLQRIVGESNDIGTGGFDELEYGVQPQHSSHSNHVDTQASDDFEYEITVIEDEGLIEDKDECMEHLQSSEPVNVAVRTSGVPKRWPKLLRPYGGVSRQCSICEANFKERHSMRYHKVMNHIKAPHVCPVCFKTFHDRTIYRRHQKGCVELLCHTCGIKCFSRARLNRHLKLQHPDSNISNEVATKTSDALEDGITLNVEEEIVEVIDGENLPSSTPDDVVAENSSKLKRIKHPHSSSRSLQCSICKRHFNNRNHLKYHSVIHHSEPRLKCSICSKAFHYARHLERHFKGCSEQRRGICDIKFPTRIVLNNHQNEAHPNSKISDHVATETFDFPEDGPTVIAEKDKVDVEVGENLPSSKPDDVETEASSNLGKRKQHSKRSQCSICKITFKGKSRSYRSYHMTTHHTEPQFKCSICSRAFHYASALERHFKGCSELRCYICEIQFPSRVHLDKHRFDAHRDSNISRQVATETSDAPEDRTTLIVEENIVEVEDGENLPSSKPDDTEAEHLNILRRIMHSPSGLRRECSICEIKFKTKLRLRHHVVRQHTEPRFKCSICSRPFHYPSDLERHYKGCSELRCFLCDKKFPSRVYLNNHNNEAHGDGSNSNQVGTGASDAIDDENKGSANPTKRKRRSRGVCLRCSICNTVFKSIYSLRNHKIVCHTEPKYKCSSCSKVFHFRRGFLLHEKCCLALPCHPCGLKFTNRLQLMHHNRLKHRKSLNSNQVETGTSGDPKNAITIDVHEDTIAVEDEGGEDPLISQSDDVGAKGSGDLGSGVERSLGSLSRQCLICEETFRNEFSLMHHQIVSHMGPRLKCSVCSKAFNYPENLRRHRERCPETRCHTCGIKFTKPAELIHHNSIKHPRNSNSNDVEAGSSDDSEDGITIVEDDTVAEDDDVIEVDDECIEVEDSQDKESQDPNRALSRRCSICKVTFKARANLRYHMIVRHTEPKNKCSTCSMAFHFPKDLHRHRKRCSKRANTSTVIEIDESDEEVAVVAETEILELEVECEEDRPDNVEVELSDVRENEANDEDNEMNDEEAIEAEVLETVPGIEPRQTDPLSSNSKQVESEESDDEISVMEFEDIDEDVENLHNSKPDNVEDKSPDEAQIGIKHLDNSNQNQTETEVSDTEVTIIEEQMDIIDLEDESTEHLHSSKPDVVEDKVDDKGIEDLESEVKIGSSSQVEIEVPDAEITVIEDEDVTELGDEDIEHLSSSNTENAKDRLEDKAIDDHESGIKDLHSDISNPVEIEAFDAEITVIEDKDIVEVEDEGKEHNLHNSNPNSAEEQAVIADFVDLESGIEHLQSDNQNQVEDKAPDTEIIVVEDKDIIEVEDECEQHLRSRKPDIVENKIEDKAIDDLENEIRHLQGGNSNQVEIEASNVEITDMEFKDIVELGDTRIEHLHSGQPENVEDKVEDEDIDDLESGIKAYGIKAVGESVANVAEIVPEGQTTTEPSKDPVVFGVSSNPKTHVYQGTDDKPWACQICGETFSKNRALQYHRTISHTEPKYKCTICGKTSHFKRVMRRHLESCVALTCHKCGEKFRKYDLLYLHIGGICSGPKAGKPAEPLNSQNSEPVVTEAEDVEDLEDEIHVTEEHVADMEGTFPESHEIPSDQTEPPGHSGSNVVDDENSDTDSQDEIEPVEENLEDLEEEESVERQKIDGTGLNDHKTTHRSEPRYKCSLCGKRFHFLLHFGRHRRDCLGLRCKRCGVTFATHDLLVKHNNIKHPGDPRNATNVRDEHSGDKNKTQSDHQSATETSKPTQKAKPARRWACFICEKVFDRRGAYFYHRMTTHTKPRYKCKICSKPFFDAANHIRHEEPCVKRDLYVHSLNYPSQKRSRNVEVKDVEAVENKSEIHEECSTDKARSASEIVQGEDTEAFESKLDEVNEEESSSIEEKSS